jgi:branched-chain amino acid transport system permease protein
MNTRSVVILGLTAVLILLPLVVSPYYVDLASKVLIFALFAMSLDLLVGHAGLFSLGHAAYFGLGAYAVGILAAKAGLSVWLALPASVVAAFVGGALFAPLALRARGSYFLMITLALAQVLWGVAEGWRTLTGGDDGLPNIPRPDLTYLSLTASAPFYYFVLLFTLLGIFALVRILQSPFGQALHGIRESETRMAALGFNVWRYRYAAFLISSALAGLAGALYAYLNRFVGPDSLFVTRSAEVLLMVIAGGAGTLFGPVVGACALVLLENTISGYTERWLSVLGIIYIVVTLLAPNGIVGLLPRAALKRRA